MSLRRVIILGTVVILILIRLTTLPKTKEPSVSLPIVSSIEFQNSVHNQGYESVHVIEADPNTNLVNVQTLESKVSFVFKIESTELANFRPPNLTLATIACQKDRKGDCSKALPYQLFVRHKLRRALIWKFYPATYVGLVHHGPGDQEGDPRWLFVEIKYGDDVNGKTRGTFNLRLVNQNQISDISKIKRWDRVRLNIDKHDPYHLFINGVKMRIVLVSL